MWYGGLDGSYGRTGYATFDPATGLKGESDKNLPHNFWLLQNYPNPLSNYYKYLCSSEIAKN